MTTAFEIRGGGEGEKYSCFPAQNFCPNLRLLTRTWGRRRPRGSGRGRTSPPRTPASPSHLAAEVTAASPSEERGKGAAAAAREAVGGASPSLEASTAGAALVVVVVDVAALFDWVSQDTEEASP